MMERRYPLDPDGKWFNLGLVAAAERLYEPPPKRPKASVPQADVEPNRELAAHFRQQDDERSRLKRQVQVHGERRADGSPTPEMEVFMVCCMRQVQANEKIFAARSRRAYQSEARMTPQQVRDALGVTATERKPPRHEDPEELRKGRIELGLEEP